MLNYSTKDLTCIILLKNGRFPQNMVPKKHGLGGVPWEIGLEVDVYGQEADRRELTRTTLVRNDGHGTQQGRSANKIQPQKSRVTPQL